MTDRPAFAPAVPAPIPARPVSRAVHDVVLTDDFGWIRADNWREVLQDPAALPAEIRALLDRENAHAAAVLKPTEALRERLVEEMQGRMEEEEAEVPVPDGPFSYLKQNDKISTE